VSLADARGVPTSTTNRHSLDRFEAALSQLQRYRGDPFSTIDEALARDPEFVTGHIFRAMAAAMMWERSVLPDINKALARLRELGDRANDRERGLIAAISAWAHGDWETMRSRLDRHLADYPRDALALQVGHVADFYHGDRDNLRGRIARALPFWRRDDPGYSFVLGMYAFGLEECADYARAEQTGREALAIEPDDCWAHHAVTHVMEMQGRHADGIAWMMERCPHWSQDDNGFAFHNWWHTALYNLDLGQADQALAIYDAGIRPRPSQIQLEMVDAVALLWRMHLQGISAGDRWSALADAYESTAEPGFYVFNDMHAMMAYLASGRSAAADRLLMEVERAAAAANTNARMTQAVGLAIVSAVHAFGHERYSTAIELLMPVRYRAHAFGGSHAQRDIVHRTLLEAAQRSGQANLALALAAERTALKPDCPFSQREWQRARMQSEIAEIAA
jgi:tetratricopeptide (TPR) repeat protein